MKKRLKITNKTKLSLNLRQNWDCLNFDFLNSVEQRKQINLNEYIQQLNSFYDRGVNFLIKYLVFDYIYFVKKKRLLLKRLKKEIQFLFFLNRLKFFKLGVFLFLKLFFSLRKLKKTKKKKRTFLNFFFNFLPFFNFSKCVIKKTSFNLQILFNITFWRNLKKFKGIRIPTSSLQNLYSSKKVVTFFLKSKRRSFFFLTKKKFFFFLLSRLKYILEKILTNCFNYNVVIFFCYTSAMSRFLKKQTPLKLKFQRFLRIPYRIKKLRNIQYHLFFSFLDGFFFCNAQFLVDEIAIGLNRIRDQPIFFKWVFRQLKILQYNHCLIHSIKFTICGKINAGTRTKFQTYKLGVSSIKNQIFALKIDYGYSSVETFTGTFGLHLWIYRRDGLYRVRLLEQVRPLRFN